MDYGEDVCMNGINERIGKERSDIPWTENKLDPELVKLVRDYEKENKPVLLELFKKYSDRDVITLHTREEADNLLMEMRSIRAQKASKLGEGRKNENI